MDDKDPHDRGFGASTSHHIHIRRRGSDAEEGPLGADESRSFGTDATWSSLSMPVMRDAKETEAPQAKMLYRSCKSSISSFSSGKLLVEEETKAKTDPTLEFFHRKGRRSFKDRMSNCGSWMSGQRKMSERAQLMEKLNSPAVRDMDVFDRLHKCCKVPPPIVLYDATTPYSLIFSTKGSVLKLVFQRLDFSFLLISHTLLSVAYYNSADNDTSRVGLDGAPTAKQWPEVPASMLSIPGMLLAFILVFYNHQCYHRFSQQYLHCQYQHGILAELVLQLRSHIPDDLMPGARTVRLNLWRMLHAVHLLGYAGLPQMRARNIDVWVWQYALEKHLLTREESERLMGLLNIGSGNLAFKEVMNTIHRQYWDLAQKQLLPAKAAHMFSDHLWRLRSQIDILYIMTGGPIPFGYFHLSNCILICYLGILAYAFIFVSPYFSIIGYALILAMFLGISELSNVLADPFGNDETDLPVFDWVNTMYNSMKELIHLPLVYDEELEAKIISKFVFRDSEGSYTFKETDDRVKIQI